MSERDDNNGDFMLILMLFMLMGIVAATVVKFKSDIRDLRQRMAVLEQERK